MLLLLVILLLATLTAARFLRNHPLGRPVTAGLALLTAALALWSTSQPSRFTVKTQAHLMGAVADTMARSLAEDFPQGGTVLVAAWTNFNGTFDRFNEGFLDVFRKHKAMKPFTLVVVSPPPVDDEANYRRVLSGFPVRQYREWANEAPGAVAMVSLVGLPAGFRAEQAEGLPPLYVANTEHLGMSGFGIDDEAIKDYRGAVALLIRARPRQNPAALPPRLASSEELFGWGYEAVRP
jgi:hypothetical protein